MFQYHRVSDRDGLTVTSFAARRVDVTLRLKFRRALIVHRESNFRKQNDGTRVETILCKFQAIALLSMDENAVQISTEKWNKKKERKKTEKSIRVQLQQGLQRRHNFVA